MSWRIPFLGKRFRLDGAGHKESFEAVPSWVIPAKAGIQKGLNGLDSCFRRNDN
jgi:hypothetical protein